MGAGQNTGAADRARRGARRAYQRALTDGTPYVREPGRGGEPVGHLGLHHHQHPAQRRQHLEQVQQHRDRDVVRQVRDQRGGRRRTRRRSAGRDLQRVGGDDREPVGERRARARRPSRAAARRAARSISTATTAATAGSSARVSEPRPGPTSSTTSSAPTSAARTMRRTVFGSMTKFCPRCLVGGSAERRGERAHLGRPEQRDARPVTAVADGQQVTAAVRPRARAAAQVEQLGAVGLLGGRRVDRVARPADAVPGAERELVEPEVRAAAADGARVAAGLAAARGPPSSGRRPRSAWVAPAVRSRRRAPWCRPARPPVTCGWATRRRETSVPWRPLAVAQRCSATTSRSLAGPAGRDDLAWSPTYRSTSWTS